MSGQTDHDPTHWRMDAEKFAGLQRLKAAYKDGQLSAIKEAWMEIELNCDFNSASELESE